MEATNSKKKKELSLDIDTSDITSKTKLVKTISKPEVKGLSLSAKKSKKSTPIKSHPIREERVTEEFAKKYPGITKYLGKTFIPCTNDTGKTIMKELADVTGKEFLSWAQSVLPISTSTNTVPYENLNIRDRIFANVVKAFATQYMFGGSEYKKKTYLN